MTAPWDRLLLALTEPRSMAKFDLDAWDKIGRAHV